VKEQYWAALMTGTLDPATNLDQVIEKFNQAGLEKVMAEAQSQLDAWRAENK
jgi:putative aldouronate transport system substrate-binding protein